MPLRKFCCLIEFSSYSIAAREIRHVTPASRFDGGNMTERVSINSGQVSREYVAWMLMEKVIHSEADIRRNSPDRKYVLDLFVECMQATGGHRPG